LSERLIAIGDIHGCDRALRGLIAAIAPTPSDTLVMLGDYIDRGPNSKAVIDLLVQLSRRTQVVAVMGNHEEMMLSVLSGEIDHNVWLKHGGLSTLDSYGFNGDRNFLPPDHFEFFQSLVDFYETEGFFFTHASYDPLLPLDRQPIEQLRWHSLRENVPGPHVSGKTAIVGHTANLDALCIDLGHLICIDTNCYGGGLLTALDVHEKAVWQVDPDGRLQA
jgi:serine/threonine protein phosphatase 1